MSVIFQQSGEGLTRDGSYFNPAADWTMLFWVDVPTITSGGATLYVFGDATYNNSNIWLGFDASGAYCQVNGVNNIGAIAFDFEIWKSFGASYNSSTHTVTLYINGASVGTVVIDISGLVFVETAEYLLTDLVGGTLGGLEAFNVRTWQSLLTATQITAEALSDTPIVTSGLLTNTPLADDSDLGDTSGNGHNWTTVGSGGSRTSPTLIPTSTANISGLTAYNLGNNFPLTVIQNNRPAGTTLTKWYRLTPGIGEISTYGLGDTIPGYGQNLGVFEGPASAPSPLLGGISGLNVPTQWPAESATEYFLKSVALDATDNPAFLVLEIEKHVSTPVVAGDILVNDDSSGFPCAILSYTEDYVVKRFIQPFPAGEEGDVLATGIMLLEDADNDQLVTKSANFNTIASIPNPVGKTVGKIRSNRGLGNFYVAFEAGASDVTIHTVNSAGTTLSALIATLTGTASIGGMAASNNGSILYFARPTANQPIRTWNLLTNTAGSNLLAAVVGYTTNAILVLPDDSLLISYYSGGVGTYVVHVSSSGVLLNTYNYGAVNVENPRLSFWLDSASFVIWLQLDTPNIGIMRFIRTKISDGSALFTRDHENFESGVYQIDPTSPPRSRYGCSFSCPMFVLQASAQPAFRSGLYKIIPTASNAGSIFKPNDTLYADDGGLENAKIPDPFADIYLIGDE